MYIVTIVLLQLIMILYLKAKIEKSMKEAFSQLCEVRIQEGAVWAIARADEVICYANENISNLTYTALQILFKIHHMKACYLLEEVGYYVSVYNLSFRQFEDHFKVSK